MTRLGACDAQYVVMQGEIVIKQFDEGDDLIKYLRTDGRKEKGLTVYQRRRTRNGTGYLWDITNEKYIAKYVK